MERWTIQGLLVPRAAGESKRLAALMQAVLGHGAEGARTMSRSILGGLLIAGLALGGCYLPNSSVQSPPPPPAAPVETVPTQPGSAYVWIPGSYTWQPASRTYVWVPGHWTIPPKGYVWVPGHWETQASGTTWVDGAWRHN